jgi:hypothetical protein
MQDGFGADIMKAKAIIREEFTKEFGTCDGEAVLDVADEENHLVVLRSWLDFVTRRPPEIL